MAKSERPRLEVHPLTRARWDDLVDLFSRRGASIARGCWCMYYRKTGGSSGLGVAAKNQKALRSLVTSGYVPGLIGYENGVPVGWVSLSPREDYLKLQRSPVMKPVDDKPVWSIVCFFVDAAARGHGVSEALLAAAIEYARAHGATLLESYPVDKDGLSRPDSMWFGSKSMFDRAGFKEVARRKAERPVMRKRVRARS